MSRKIRSIKPEVLDDEIAADLSDAAWRLWVSSWLLADDYGNLRFGARYVASCVWQNTGHDVHSAMAELVEKGFLRPYSIRGQQYAHVTGFAKHQRLDNRGKPKVPGAESAGLTGYQALSAVSADFAADSWAGAEVRRLAHVARAQSGGRINSLSGSEISDPELTPPLASLGYPLAGENEANESRDELVQEERASETRLIASQSVADESVASMPMEAPKEPATPNIGATPGEQLALVPDVEPKSDQKPQGKNRFHALPSDFGVTPEMKLWAQNNNLPDPDTEIDQFRDHHTAKGSLFKNWSAAFRTWLRNTQRFAGRAGKAIDTRTPGKQTGGVRNCGSYVDPETLELKVANGNS